jgi:hypothetical protein
MLRLHAERVRRHFRVVENFSVGWTAMLAVASTTPRVTTN